MKAIKFVSLIIFGIANILTGNAAIAQDDPKEESAREAIAKTEERQEDILRQQLDDPYPNSGFWHDEDFAFGAYYFNEKTREADAGLIGISKTFMTEMPDNAHWHVYLLARLYWMYSSVSDTPRMSSGAEAALLTIMNEYLTKSHYISMDMGNSEYVWTYQESENHHLQAYISAWSAAHILKEHAEYENMIIDGITVDSLARSLDSYFKVYFKEKATKGLLTEIASPTYVKYSLNTIYNIYDFTDDTGLKDLTGMFLNLYFADWAIEQFDGLRGGSKHRSYPGRDSYQLNGNVGWFPFGLGSPTKHPGFMCAATTTWRPEVLVAELALAQENRGAYEIISRRPGLKVEGRENNREASPEGGKLLRYTYHTPEFIMGMSMVPLLKHDDWTGISCQNRSNQILFGGLPAKIYTQRFAPSSGSVYNTEWGVQHKGLMLLQMLPSPYSKSANGQLVFFSASLNILKTTNWVFVEAANAYCAIMVLKGNSHLREPTKDDFREGKGDINDGVYLELEEPLSPILFEVVPKTNYNSYTDFRTEIRNNYLSINGNTIKYRSKAYDTELTFYTDFSNLPEINDTKVDLTPAFVYQSPFINSQFGQEIITISMGDKNMLLDFTMNAIEYEEHITICPGEEYKGWTETGIYESTDTLASGNECLLTTYLEVETLKPTIVRSGDRLRTEKEYAAYQWYSSAGSVSGETQQDYLIDSSGYYFLEATSVNGCIFRSDTAYYMYTFLDDIEINKPDWSVVPNPADKEITLKFDSNPTSLVSVKIFNSLGKLILQREIKYQAINQIEYFDVSDLKEGMYYVVISDNLSKSSRKIFIY